MAEDRFANIFTASVTMSAANTLTFAELNFGITLRDRIAIVVDQVFWYPSSNAYGFMTTAADRLIMAVTISDSITDISDLTDRRMFFHKGLIRADWGTAGAADLLEVPLISEFTPPLIILPNRIFLGLNSVGLASPVSCTIRMHYRTVSITQDQQLIEVLESLQQST